MKSMRVGKGIVVFSAASLRQFLLSMALLALSPVIGFVSLPSAPDLS